MATNMSQARQYTVPVQEESDCPKKGPEISSLPYYDNSLLSQDISGIEHEGEFSFPPADTLTQSAFCSFDSSATLRPEQHGKRSVGCDDEIVSTAGIFYVSPCSDSLQSYTNKDDSSLSSRSILFGNTESDCADCSILSKHMPFEDSKEFWLSVPLGGHGPNHCHIKKWDMFHQRLKEAYPDEEILNSAQTMAFMKFLLGASSDLTASIHYDKYVRLVRYFGPLRKNDPVMLRQLYDIVRKSTVTRKTANGISEKISWFAGDMNRDEADRRLSNTKNGTYLIRMSQTRQEETSFVISVKHIDVVKHFEIEQDNIAAAKSDPFSAHLSLNNQLFDSLVDIVRSLLYDSLKDEESEENGEIWCKYICPGLPLNGTITGYRKSRLR